MTIILKKYDEIMSGCYKQFTEAECVGNERARMEQNLEQISRQHNYTEIGFKKIRAPAGISYL